ncbi:MAG TPA: TolC family protein [Candidatus Krumholzibacteria bacterium]|nr:TolC family protein [Candidatus Krumholzibacteria bacterium]HRX51465.1 TolC family protein [Candidatus Krumholzibacteria bacterium]
MQRFLAADRRGVALAVPLVLLTCLAAPSARAEAPLGLGEALRLVADQSHAAMRAEADATAAAAEVDGARAGWWPHVSAEGSYTTRDNPVEVGVGPVSFQQMPQSNGQYGVAARELLWAGGRRGLAVDAARERERAVLARGDAGVRAAQLGLVDAYLDAIELGGQMQVLQARLASLEGLHAAVADLLREGLVARNDLLQTEVRQREVADAAASVADARGLARADLNRRLGRAGAEALTLPDSLPPAPELPASREALTAAAAAANPELAAADAVLQASRAAALLAHRAWTPEVFLTLSHGWQENEALIHPTVNAAALGVSWDLFDGGARKAAARAADARVTAADRDRVEAARGAELAVASAWNAWLRSRREAATARTNVAAAAENLRIVSDQYRNGLARAADALDAEALLASARFTELTRRHAAYRAQARLLAAAGYDLAAFYDDNAAEDRR